MLSLALDSVGRTVTDRMERKVFGLESCMVYVYVCIFYGYPASIRASIQAPARHALYIHRHHESGESGKSGFGMSQLDSCAAGFT